MAKNNPVKVWIIKQSPNKDPKFHQAEIFEGAGRSTKLLLTILIKGWLSRMGLFICIHIRIKINNV